jgi:SAM-dependent methyltransferase
MKSLFPEFIASLSLIRSFSPVLQQIYADIITQFKEDPSTKGFAQMSKSEWFTDSTLRGVALRMFRWFPTHFFKFQDALLKWEARCHKHSQPFLLDRPQVTFVDLGCGTGAASAAVLATLEQYHTFLQQQHIRVTPVHVRLIALDPVYAELDVYTRFIGTLAARLKTQKIFVSLQTVCQRFPEGTPQLLETLSALQGHVLIIGMSNLIRWIWKEADLYLETGQLKVLEQLQPAEVTALELLATHTQFDVLHVVGIATKSDNSWWLANKISKLFTKVAERLRLIKRPLGERWQGFTRISFENPQGSYWITKQPRTKIRYFVENLLNTDPKFLNDTRLHQVLSLDTLEVAWVKAQNYMKYEPLVDHVELKLFEQDLETELQCLREACLERNAQYLNVDDDLPYDIPKNEDSTRPMSLAHLEEQIIAAAIGICFQKELDGPCPRVSYNYRLAPHDSEFLYQYWFELYNHYLTDIVKQLEDKKVCTTDIKSFYPNINQFKLAGIVRQRLDGSVRCYEMLANILVRDCHLQACYPAHPPNYGLLQGHAFSGLLANVMLQPVDERLIQHHGLRDRYYRYTDDITVTGIENMTTPDHIEEIQHIQEELSKHDNALKLHSGEGKTHLYETPSKFIRTIGRDIHLNDISARFYAFFVPLFVMDIPYQWKFRRSGWSFVVEYQKLLASVGILFSSEWLFRKLDEYKKPKKLLKSFRRLLKKRKLLRFPAFPSSFNEATEEEWKDTFEHQNTLWLQERHALRLTLNATCKSAVNNLLRANLKEPERKYYARRFKFSLYRLSAFGIDDVAPLITFVLISQPWNVPVGIACRALARSRCENELFQVIEQSPFSYVRALALRALGSIGTERSILQLVLTMDESHTCLEQLMTSEALLEPNVWQRISLERIRKWLEQTADDPYQHKNIVLILAQAYPIQARPILQALDAQPVHVIVHRAIHYALTKPSEENLLLKPEHDAIRKYRATSYPTIEEFVEDEGSYRFVS